MRRVTIYETKKKEHIVEDLDNITFYSIADIDPIFDHELSLENGRDPEYLIKTANVEEYRSPIYRIRTAVPAEKFPEYPYSGAYKYEDKYYALDKELGDLLSCLVNKDKEEAKYLVSEAKSQLKEAQQEKKYEVAARILGEIRKLKAIDDAEQKFEIIITVKEPTKKEEQDGQ